MTSTLPHSFARRHLALPVHAKDGCLTVAMANPFDVEILDNIARVVHMKVKPVVSSGQILSDFLTSFTVLKGLFPLRRMSLPDPQLTWETWSSMCG